MTTKNERPTIVRLDLEEQLRASVEAARRPAAGRCSAGRTIHDEAARDASTRAVGLLADALEALGELARDAAVRPGAELPIVSYEDLSDEDDSDTARRVHAVAGALNALGRVAQARQAVRRTLEELDEAEAERVREGGGR